MILNRSMLCAEKPEMTFVVQNFLLLAMEYLQRQVKYSQHRIVYVYVYV